MIVSAYEMQLFSVQPKRIAASDITLVGIRTPATDDKKSRDIRLGFFRWHVLIFEH